MYNVGIVYKNKLNNITHTEWYSDTSIDLEGYIKYRKTKHSKYPYTNDTPMCVVKNKIEVIKEG
jgi:hypothetical protein